MSFAINSEAIDVAHVIERFVLFLSEQKHSEKYVLSIYNVVHLKMMFLML